MMAQASSFVPLTLKVRSKNPTDFEYWFRQQLMSKIRNDFIKQHQRGRWRYLSLIYKSMLTHASLRESHCTKTLQKLTAL